MLDMSIQKQSCENYLFKDYQVKSGIAMWWILALRTTGSNKRDRGEKFSAPDSQIACQIPLLPKGEEKGRYDLQTVSFCASQNALKIAGIQTSVIS
jgi:hypothetical protein